MEDEKIEQTQRLCGAISPFSITRCLRGLRSLDTEYTSGPQKLGAFSQNTQRVFMPIGHEHPLTQKSGTICWPSSQARVTSTNSFCSLRLQNAVLTFSWKSFHFRQSFSDMLNQAERTLWWLSLNVACKGCLGNFGKLSTTYVKILSTRVIYLENW